ncbi:MAG: acyl-CoA dehydrogenase C-terminal domain-containing protein [Neomegalonema sp.]|nr:acyl-CoA dehydrogenase C-terminal domain-containing protein [Neomegalonema sp.]
MPTFTPPLRDYQFVLHETLKIDQNTAVAGYADMTADMTSAVLAEAGRLASEMLIKSNTTGDQEGCKLENGQVRTPSGYQEAFAALREGGWPSLECHEEYGGQGMPSVISLAVGEMHSAANMALMMYQGLTHGAYSALHAHGTAEQKNTYLPKLASGEWTGTMNLTEPQCGTDLGLIRTKAEPQEDGSYLITGQKIFISAGDHDLAQNIIHLVLAKIPGGPEGVKGISLFVVPKIQVGADGALGQRNNVSCGKLEEKMGIHGNATCVMNYDGAVGWLVGEPHKGLRAMFTMMNEARLLVGMQGLAQATIAYQNAAEYARDRLQGRAVTGAEAPDKPADPLIVHPDVRRMLMDQRAFIEGGRAFLLWGSTLIDAEKHHQDEAARDDAGAMIALLTPVLKGFLTDKGYENASQAQQVFGGHGYIEEWGMSQYVRDARIAMIYEGANGVQALDLVGRKLGQNGGKAIMRFFEVMREFAKENGDDEELKAEFLAPLKEASGHLQEAGMYFMQAGLKNPNDALAGSNDFLHLFGHTALGFMWALMAKAARQALAEGTDDKAFYEAKLTTGRYFMTKLLPETGMRLARIKAGSAQVMALPAEAF